MSFHITHKTQFLLLINLNLLSKLKKTLIKWTLIKWDVKRWMDFSKKQKMISENGILTNLRNRIYFRMKVLKIYMENNLKVIQTIKFLKILYNEPLRNLYRITDTFIHLCNQNLWPRIYKNFRKKRTFNKSKFSRKNKEILNLLLTVKFFQKYHQPSN